MDDLEFTETEKKALLHLAREAIVRRLSGETMKPRPLSESGASQDPKLNRPSAVFISLYTRDERAETSSLDFPSEERMYAKQYKRGELRGCVGTTEAKYPLSAAVARYAVSAAMEDSRFLPLAREELPECEIEISILSSMRRVNPREIRPGIDGVMVKRETRQGLFLPQVWEDLKEPERFLSLLCSQKAGLPPDAWKDPKTEIYTFTVTILK